MNKALLTILSYIYTSTTANNTCKQYLTHGNTQTIALGVFLGSLGNTLGVVRIDSRNYICKFVSSSFLMMCMSICQLWPHYLLLRNRRVQNNHLRNRGYFEPPLYVWRRILQNWERTHTSQRRAYIITYRI